jgi:hypothetical protein
MAYSMLCRYALANLSRNVEFFEVMRALTLFLAAAIGAAVPVAAADAQGRGDPQGRGLQRGREQDNAYRAMQQGQILPLPQIRSRIRVPGATFIGVEFDGRIYRLKYMRGSDVIWIDVDAQTGRILGRTGD